MCCRKLVIVTLNVIFLLLPAKTIYASSFPKYPTTDEVRVLLSSFASQATISTYSPSSLLNSDTGKVILKNQTLKNLKISAKSRGILLNQRPTGYKKLKIVPGNGGIVKVNNQFIKGSVEVINNKRNLQIINILNVEEYLASVVLGEIGEGAPLEALKAQAVASRTYTLYSMLRSKTREYDVRKSSQNYPGSREESPVIKKAVKQTKDEIMVRNGGDLFPAFFHGVCGGATEYAGNVWKGEIYPLGVKCTYCKGAKHYSWKAAIPIANMVSKFKKAGYKIKDIRDIIPYKKSKVSARITVVKVRDSRNREAIIRTDKVRNIIGPDLIRSTNFKVKVIKDMVHFRGLGWGHGVGMCQAGAVEMAKMGCNYKKILKYYYPDVRFKTI